MAAEIERQRLALLDRVSQQWMERVVLVWYMQYSEWSVDVFC